MAISCPVFTFMLIMRHDGYIMSRIYIYVDHEIKLLYPVPIYFYVDHEI